MFNGLSPTYKGILLALGGYTSFAITDICAKWLSAHYSVYQVIVAQNGLACVLLIAFSPFLGGMGDLFSRRNWRVNAFRAGINVLIAVILTYSYKHFALADVYTLIFTLPFMMALLALWFFREPVTPSRWIAIGAGFAGVVIAMRPGAADFDPMLIIALAGTMLVALLYISSRFLKDPTAFSVGFVPAFGAAILCLPLAVTGFKMPDMAHLPVFLLMSAAIGFGITAVSLAYRMAAAAVVAPFLYVEMVWALAAGWLIFGDVPDGWMLAGALIIILSGIYLLRAERRSNNSPKSRP
jgi:drug/metabolite transporter (DMT)-like permease